MTESIAIVGSGLIGRTLALSLVERGHEIVLYDRDTELGAGSCARAAAGMLALIAELEHGEEPVFLLGKDAVNFWSEIIALTGEPVLLRQQGTIVVAHSQDQPQLQQFHERVARRLADLNEPGNKIRLLSQEQLAELEPGLATRFSRALHLPDDGILDNDELMTAMGTTLKRRCKAWHTSVEATPMPYAVKVDNQQASFSSVIDCRGTGARDAFPQLRGVRGELIHVHAPDVDITRPVRLMHPRYSIYIVPRADNRYVIGATSIESDDMKAITVQSTLELLSSAFSINSGFSEATIEDLRVNCRPALPDNLPLITHEPGLMRVNGLYRHGFLVTPGLVQLMVGVLETGKLPQQFEHLFSRKEAAKC